MRRILRKIAEGEADKLGDTSTLADPSIVEVCTTLPRHLSYSHAPQASLEGPPCAVEPQGRTAVLGVIPPFMYQAPAVTDMLGVRSYMSAPTPLPQ